MGMFDDLLVDYPLPQRPEWAKCFQTKDLSCELERYTLTEDGRLVDGVGALVPYTGGVNFYTGAADTQWIEYVALIKRGHVIDVELVKLESMEPLTRRTSDDQ